MDAKGREGSNDRQRANLGLYLIDVDADTSRLLLDQPAIGDPYGGTVAHISGDGTKLVFNAVTELDPTVGDEDLGGEVYVLDIETGGITQVTDRSSRFGSAGIEAVDGTADTIILDPFGTLNDVDLSPLESRAVLRRRESNRPPQLSVPGIVHIPEGQRTAIPLTATDPDGDPITFYAERVPPFVIGGFNSRLADLASSELVDHGDGTAEVAFTPRYTDAGEYPLRLAAFDDEGGVDVADVTLIIDDTQKEGDANCDGTIGADDVDALIHALFDPGQVATCPTSDADGDGSVRANDLMGLIELLGSTN